MEREEGRDFATGEEVGRSSRPPVAEYSDA